MKVKQRKEVDRSPAKGRTADSHPRGRQAPTRAERRRRAAGPPRDFPTEPEDVTCPDDVRRIVFTRIMVPRLCEERACRRSLRCVGSVQLPHGGYGLACWERHHDVLQPFWAQYVIPKIRALPYPKDEQDN